MKKGLWANIHAKRKRGERMRRKGEKGAPTPDAIRSAQRNEDAPTMNISTIPDPKATAMGPRLKTYNVTDRRRRKDKVPVLLKRFRKYHEDLSNEQK
jgi:hypothetical protein